MVKVSAMMRHHETLQGRFGGRPGAIGGEHMARQVIEPLAVERHEGSKKRLVEATASRGRAASFSASAMARASASPAGAP